MFGVGVGGGGLALLRAMPVAAGPRRLVCSRRAHTAAAEHCVALTRQRRATVVSTQVHTRIACSVHVFAQPENAMRICLQAQVCSSNIQ